MSVIDALESKDAGQAKEASHRDPTKLANLAGAIKTYVDMWPAQPSYQDVIRASGIGYMCPREFVLNYWMPTPNKTFDLRSQFMMGCGSYLHEVIQNMVLGPMGVLKGYWRKYGTDPSRGDYGQLISANLFPEYHPDPKLAIWEHTNQKPLTWRYEEFQLWDKELRIAGHMDGVVSLDKIEWLADNYKMVRANPAEGFKQLAGIPEGDEAKLEIKTCGSWIYKKLRMPSDISDPYKMQSNVYQKLSGVHRAVFWYVERDSMDSKMIPYWFEKHIWDHAANKAKVIWRAIRDRTLPDAFKRCPVPQDRKVKSCIFRNLCWHDWTPGQFDQWCNEQVAAQPDRKWLDLSGVPF